MLRDTPNTSHAFCDNLSDTVPVIPTGFAELDDALRIGGVPRGRVTELLGTPTSGMTTIGLTLIARAQAQGNLAGYLDLSWTLAALGQGGWVGGPLYVDGTSGGEGTALPTSTIGF